MIALFRCLQPKFLIIFRDNVSFVDKQNIPCDTDRTSALLKFAQVEVLIDVCRVFSSSITNCGFLYWCWVSVLQFTKVKFDNISVLQMTADTAVMYFFRMHNLLLKQFA